MAPGHPDGLLWAYERLPTWRAPAERVMSLSALSGEHMLLYEPPSYPGMDITHQTALQ